MHTSSTAGARANTLCVLSGVCTRMMAISEGKSSISAESSAPSTASVI